MFFGILPTHHLQFGLLHGQARQQQPRGGLGLGGHGLAFLAAMGWFWVASKVCLKKKNGKIQDMEVVHTWIEKLKKIGLKRKSGFSESIALLFWT